MRAADRELLLELLSEVRLLRAEFSRRRGGPADPATDARLVVTIAHAVGGRVFSVRDLMAHARVDRTLDAGLTTAGLKTARAVGRALSRLRDRVVGPVVLRRVTRDQTGTVWALYPVESHTDCGASRGPHVG